MFLARATLRSGVRHLRAPHRGALLAGAGLVALTMAGLIGYVSFGYSPTRAVAMTLLTLTTVGFATNQAVPTDVEIFTAILAVLGVGLFAAIVGLAATSIVEGRVSLFSRRRRMQRQIDQLNQHLIVCAYGRVGRSIARELERELLPFVVIDSKLELQAEMQRDGVLYVIGTPSDEGVLRLAGIERARGLICAVDSDAENVYITIVARSLRPELQIVARAAEDRSADRLYRAGANKVVSPYVTSGRRMANLATRPHVVDFFDIAQAGQPDLRLEELVITSGSPLLGRSIEDLSGRAVPLLLRRHGGELLANPAHRLRLEEGDVLVVYGEAGALQPLD
ncbi:MAG TPA: potassium channel protein [Acidimicrobiales bacterium]|nr:potassium channel protein [Acidimicrobiales bacterium]